MLQTPEFWVAVAFFVFLGIVWKVGGFKSIIESLDKRGTRIRAELDEAQRLRVEAEALLNEYTRRRDEAEREAETIVASAREEAERIGEEAHQRLTDFVARRTAAAEAKIAQAETAAAQQVRAAAADAAVRASAVILTADMRAGGGEALLARSLGEVRAKLHA
ncbi:MAG: synthase subunit [Enterovirga sp.]|nr:synthase subunit [Enterovirga sp.]